MYPSTNLCCTRKLAPIPLLVLEPQQTQQFLPLCPQLPPGPLRVHPPLLPQHQVEYVQLDVRPDLLGPPARHEQVPAVKGHQAVQVVALWRGVPKGPSAYDIRNILGMFDPLSLVCISRNL